MENTPAEGSGLEPFSDQPGSGSDAIPSIDSIPDPQANPIGTEFRIHVIPAVGGVRPALDDIVEYIAARFEEELVGLIVPEDIVPENNRFQERILEIVMVDRSASLLDGPVARPRYC